MSIGCDFVDVAAEEYLKGARDLANLGAAVKKRFKTDVSPEVLDAALKKAAARYKMNFRDVEAIKVEMAKTVAREAYAAKPTLSKIAMKAGDVIRAPRSLMTSMDVSATLRQGAFMSSSHPRLAFKAFGEELRAIFGSKKYGMSGDEFTSMVDAEIRSRPNAPLYEKADLYLTPADAPLDVLAKEEAFQSNLAEHIPGIGKIVRASNRGYNTFLNKMRADVFDSMLSDLRKSRPDAEISEHDIRGIADYVNKASGRGSLGEIGDKAQTLLSTVFFSPRYAASRVQMLTGEPLWNNPNASMAVKKIIAKEYARSVAVALTVVGMAKLAGASVESDPRSSDFMKIRVGKTRFDTLAGLQQYMTLVSRMVTGQKKSLDGRVMDYGAKGPYGETRTEAIARFGRGKLAPIPALAVDVFSSKTTATTPPASAPWYDQQIGSDFVGRPVSTLSTARRLVTPLGVTDFMEAAKAEGIPMGVAAGLASALGIGVQTVPDKVTKPKSTTNYMMPSHR